MKIIKVSLAALSLMVLVGCGNKSVPLPPAPPVTNPQGGYGGGGSCGAMPAQTGGISPTYFTFLTNVGQQGGQFGGQGGQFGGQGGQFGGQGGQFGGQGGQFGGQQLPSSLTLTFTAINTQNQIGVQQPQYANANGCMNWADLISLYPPQYPGQPQQVPNTGVPLQAQQPIVVNPDGSFQDLILYGTVNIPTYGAAASAVQMILYVPGGRINPYQGNRLQVQNAQVRLNNQQTQFVYSSRQ